MKKPDYLPTHDHYYAWIANNRDELFEIFDIVHGEGDGEWIAEKLNQDPDLEYNFETQPINSRAGYWDIKASLKHCSRNSTYGLYLEYKTSLEEDNIESVIRKIKKRFEGSKYKTKHHLKNVVFVTFDKRFEKFKPILENENITTLIFRDSVRKKLEKNFDDSKSEKNSLQNFS